MTKKPTAPIKITVSDKSVQITGLEPDLASTAEGAFRFGGNKDCRGHIIDELPLEALLYEAQRPESTKDTRASRRCLLYYFGILTNKGQPVPTALSAFIANIALRASDGHSVDILFMPPTQIGSETPSLTKGRKEAMWELSPAYEESLIFTELAHPELKRDLVDTTRHTSYEVAGESLAKGIPNRDQTENHRLITAIKLKTQIRLERQRRERLQQVQTLLDQFYDDNSLGSLDYSPQNTKTILSKLQALYLPSS
ncbi:MAG: hypothetical protein P1U47_14865 [Zhongshania sp.]|uniref:hypothetical protein n=1 Tax=Zhongshania sp. TaxID=1971902 RepID=UPI00262B2D0E|nr:hypothetical protein [Zhongshania sp.]MDF1693659.1 hypothetical protein [Zhongshania sp.]